MDPTPLRLHHRVFTQTYWIALVSAVGFAASFAIAFGASLFMHRSPNPSVVTNAGEPKPTVKEASVVCPLNGVAYPVSQQKWQDRRPLGVMIENSVVARPQSGLTRADVIYEASVEGGITRFLAVFLCQDANPIGPIRSARAYYLDWISEYNGLYAHIGGANTPGPADALGQIQRYNILDLDEFSLGSPTFTRDSSRLPGVANEHTAYSSTAKLWEAASKKGWGAIDNGTGVAWNANFDPWKFSDGPQASVSGQKPATTVTVPFSGGTNYIVRWTYDPTTKSYRRAHSATPHIDNTNKEPIMAKDIIILFIDEKRADDGYPLNQHLVYGTIGAGDAYIIHDGAVTYGTWRKKDRTAKTKFYDTANTELTLTPGQIWVEVLPNIAKGSVKIQ